MAHSLSVGNFLCGPSSHKSHAQLPSFTESNWAFAVLCRRLGKIRFNLVCLIIGELLPKKRMTSKSVSLRWPTLMGLIGALVMIAIVLSACRTEPVAQSSVPRIPGATFVGNQVCFDCHTNISRSFVASPHARIQVVDLAMKGEAGCESCHGPGSEHVRLGGGRGKAIVNPGRDSSACFKCHQEIHAQLQLPHHHPVIEGAMNCVQCHDPHGMDIFKPAGGLAFAQRDQSCATCHRDETRPHVFIHEALREGCAACHQPHGSINDKLLVARDNNLCLRCHAQIANPQLTTGSISIGATPHAAYLSRGTCWSAGCHTAVHGSNVDDKLRF